MIIMNRAIKASDLELAKEIRVRQMLNGKETEQKFIRDTHGWKVMMKRGDNWVVDTPETFDAISVANTLNAYQKRGKGQMNIVDLYGNGFTNMVYGDTRVN